MQIYSFFRIHKSCSFYCNRRGHALEVFFYYYHLLRISSEKLKFSILFLLLFLFQALLFFLPLLRMNFLYLKCYQRKNDRMLREEFLLR
jgi:hypothetical protein